MMMNHAGHNEATPMNEEFAHLMQYLDSYVGCTLILFLFIYFSKKKNISRLQIFYVSETFL